MGKLRTRLKRHTGSKIMQEQYFTIEEIAKMLKVTYLTVYRWIQAGKLLSVKAGKQYRIKKSDLDNFLSKK